MPQKPVHQEFPPDTSLTLRPYSGETGLGSLSLNGLSPLLCPGYLLWVCLPQVRPCQGRWWWSWTELNLKALSSQAWMQYPRVVTWVVWEEGTFLFYPCLQILKADLPLGLQCFRLGYDWWRGRGWEPGLLSQALATWSKRQTRAMGLSPGSFLHNCRQDCRCKWSGGEEVASFRAAVSPIGLCRSSALKRISSDCA